MALGSGITSGSGTALAVVVLGLAPSTWIQLRFEDDALARAFGGRYATYAQRVGWMGPLTQPR